MEQKSGFLTKILESVFSTHRNETPVHTIRRFHEWSTMRPFDKRPTFRFRPFDERPTMRPFHERPTLSPPLRPHWDSKPPDIKTQPPSNAAGAFSLEKLLWVVLSGFGVMVLMAIFMKLGGPIRRVRRQLTNVRPRTLRPDGDGDVGNMDMSSLLRSSGDLPPPYAACARRGARTRDVDEPPPRYSACSAAFPNPKDAEPQVHMQRQNDPIEIGLKVESVPMNNSESVAQGMRKEVVFDNGRIVERLR